MEFKEAVQLALQALWSNKMRSVLTLLGIVIGVASVIAVVTLVNGANTFVASKINHYGADVFTITKQPGIVTSYDDYIKFGKRKNILLDDYHYIRDNCSLCSEVGALQSSTGKVVYGTESSTDTTIRGYTWTMPEMQNLNIVQGRGFMPADDEHAAPVALIGSDIQENLMNDGDPIGKEIRVDGVPYTVIGLGEKQGKTLGQSQDNWVAVPLSAFQKTYGSQKTIAIYAKAGSGTDALTSASDQARQLMRSRRHDAPGQEDSFTMETSDTLVGLWTSVSQNFEVVAVAIAGLSLVVGGIVIMNIMLVSVTERTREIGVRKALGARKQDILRQFLIESGIMAMVGGLIGVFGGMVVAEAVTLLLGFPSTVALWSVFAGLFVATSVGIFFGVYPARKAAQLDPIVALRSEL